MSISSFCSKLLPCSFPRSQRWRFEWRVGEHGAPSTTSPPFLSAAGLGRGLGKHKSSDLTAWGSGLLSVGWLLLFKTKLAVVFLCVEASKNGFFVQTFPNLSFLIFQMERK